MGEEDIEVVEDNLDVARADLTAAITAHAGTGKRLDLATARHSKVFYERDIYIYESRGVRVAVLSADVVADKFGVSSTSFTTASAEEKATHAIKLVNHIQEATIIYADLVHSIAEDAITP